MSVFISYNHKSGQQVAMAVAESLRTVGLDPWWFPDPLHPEQVDAMVGNALANCSRCIFVWSSHEISNWTFFELMSIRNHFSNRLPSKEPSECFLIVRDCRVIESDATLPMFSECEYIDYHPDEKMNLSFLDATHPGLIPLMSGEGRCPILDLPQKPDLHIGRLVLHGPIGNISGRTMPLLFCWIFLDDCHGNRYIQQPRPTLTHKSRWGGAPIFLGKDICAIRLAALDNEAHVFVVNSVLKQSFGGRPPGEFPGNYFVLDSREFAPLVD